jgi:hypothetical protein
VSMTGRTLVTAAGLCTVASGCDSGLPETRQAFFVFDSSGVAVAENRWDEAAVSAWELSEPPILRLLASISTLAQMTHCRTLVGPRSFSDAARIGTGPRIVR